MQIARDGTPKLKGLAQWMLDNLDQIAFHSIRTVAQIADSNPNNVIRIASQLGYSGYDAMRADVQKVVSARSNAQYSSRAQALRTRDENTVLEEIARSRLANMESIFHEESLSVLLDCIDPLLKARKVYSVGVRSCFSVAHYFSYVGGMAFDNFEPAPSQPGAIQDQMTGAGSKEIVMAITYQH